MIRLLLITSIALLLVSCERSRTDLLLVRPAAEIGEVFPDTGARLGLRIGFRRFEKVDDLVGLPGNPVAAFVCTLIFARPALLAMSGAGWQEPVAETRTAAFSKRRKAGRREYLRARLAADGSVEVFANEGSGLIRGLVWATGLVDLPDGGPDIAAGDPVAYLPFHGFGI